MLRRPAARRRMLLRSLIIDDSLMRKLSPDSALGRDLPRAIADFSFHGQTTLSSPGAYPGLTPTLILGHPASPTPRHRRSGAYGAMIAWRRRWLPRLWAISQPIELPEQNDKRRVSLRLCLMR